MQWHSDYEVVYYSLCSTVYYRLYTKSSHSKSAWRFNLSFPWVSVLFLNSWRVSVVTTLPPSIQKQHWHPREAQIEPPLFDRASVSGLLENRRIAHTTVYFRVIISEQWTRLYMIYRVYSIERRPRMSAAFEIKFFLKSAAPSSRLRMSAHAPYNTWHYRYLRRPSWEDPKCTRAPLLYMV
jgi:hypothetical protein